MSTPPESSHRNAIAVIVAILTGALVGLIGSVIAAIVFSPIAVPLSSAITSSPAITSIATAALPSTGIGGTLVLTPTSEISGTGTISETTPTLTSRETTPTTPTLTSREIADSEYKKLQHGISVFNPPHEMSVGENELVTYRILLTSLEPSAMTPQSAPPLNAVNRQVITGTLQLASRMKVSLDGGDAFTIQRFPEEETEKLILPNVPNDWDWNVTAIRPGEHTLRLLVTAEIDVGAEKIPYAFPVQETTVTVDVNWGLLAENILQNSWTQFAGILSITPGCADRTPSR